MTDDFRVCFLGDSFVAGIGDPDFLGWVGRIAARTHSRQPGLTAYNLGVRHQTSRDVRARWGVECGPRLTEGYDCRVVVSFGVNDTTIEGGRSRVSPDDSVANLSGLLGELAEVDFGALVVGPTPVCDAGQNRRIARLDEAFKHSCLEARVTYVDVFSALSEDTVWMTEVRNGDGAHPSRGGYRQLADAVWPRWIEWLSVNQ